MSSRFTRNKAVLCLDDAQKTRLVYVRSDEDGEDINLDGLPILFAENFAEGNFFSVLLFVISFLSFVDIAP